MAHTERARECRERQLQYFWEVFPAQDGITTYMFAYTDPTAGMGPPSQPVLAAVLPQLYWPA